MISSAQPDFTFTVDKTDTENGVTVYDLKGVDQNGGRIELEVSAQDGTVVADDEKDGGENDKNGDGENDAGKQADLAVQAAISEADAIAAAEAANSGYTFTADELDSKNGVIVCSLKGTDAGGAKLEVKINAADGSVVQDSEKD